MKTRRGTIIMIVVGLVICVVVVAAGAGAWFFASAFDSTESDEVTAAREFDEVKRRLGSSDPIIQIQNERAVIARKPPVEAPTGELQRVQILAWQPDEERLTRVTLPWWLVRLRSGSFDLNSESGSGFHTRITITPEEIERYGPALLVFHTEPDGRRVLVWTE
jgi:hypothetical protein